MYKTINKNRKYLFVLSLLFSSAQFAFAAEGDLDVTFNPTGSGPTQPGTVFTTIGTSATIFSIAMQSDGKIVAGGIATVGTNRFALARYNTDGSLDSTFGTGGIVTTAIPGSTTSQIGSIAIQSDGKIVAGGRTTISGVLQFVLVRYNADGSVDNTFGNNGIVTTIIGTLSGINSIAIQSDGKIVAGGFARISGVTQFALARYNTDGSLDNTFGNNGIVTTIIGSSSSIVSIELQSDGKIVAGGSATISGVTQFALARYNADGSLDNTFGNNGIVTTIIGSLSVINSIKLQSDGKVVAGGFTTISGVTQFALARYNADGSLDNTFGNNGIVTTIIDTSTSSSITSILIQANGKIVAGGSATIGGSSKFAIARYLANTTLIQSLITIAIKNKYCGNGA